MTRKHRPKDQIRAILREASNFGGSIRSFCKEHGISEQNFYRWKRQFPEVDAPKALMSLSPDDDSQKPVDLVRENERLKILIAELYMEQARLRAVLESKRKRSAA